MSWDDGLSAQQRDAATYMGSHSCLLAGPGTGKTRVLTGRVCFLIGESSVHPDAVLALTFTRAAAHELRKRVEAELGEGRIPRISTLHSFALRQLLRNSARISNLPQPLRIADSWEERNIILEDIKTLLDLPHVNNARVMLNELSADWEDLTEEQGTGHPNPRFLAAWEEHRRCMGYTLRAELVYQLKRALEFDQEFQLEGPPAHLLVDEYQDMNRCDLAVIKAMGDLGTQVFAAGDDDQSIYGFRKAHPAGIRRFCNDYKGAGLHNLELCFRCYANILDLGTFVAEQDTRRAPKQLSAAQEGGEVRLLSFINQDREARGVARICRRLIADGLRPYDILILLRSDRNGVFSSVLRTAMEQENVPVAAKTDEDEDVLNKPTGRLLLSLLRIALNPHDHLAWRTWLQVRPNGVGLKARQAIYNLAREQGIGFANAVEYVANDPTCIGVHHGRCVQSEFHILQETVGQLPHSESTLSDAESILRSITPALDRVCVHVEDRDQICRRIVEIATTSEAGPISALVQQLNTSDENLEQETEQDKVNILTMHRAKGLEAKAVIVVACEDEYIPGRATGTDIDDERRLLYVSLTRAKQDLFVTFCAHRNGPQRHTGRTAGRSNRQLTRFLYHGPVRPVRGDDYVAHL